MAFKLPQVFDIYAQVDGRRVKGSYAFVVGLTVYYKGDAETVSRPDRADDVPVVAREVLTRLVQKRIAQSQAVPRELPTELRQAATAYLNSGDDERAIRKLVSSFGQGRVGSESHEQVSCLLLNALTPIVPFWTEMCDDDVPIETHNQLTAWFSDRTQHINWETATLVATPMHDGVAIAHCDACRVEPLARSVAACAKYLRGDGNRSAIEAIFDADCAHAEGCWPSDERRAFPQWLVETALPHAYRRELLD